MLKILLRAQLGAYWARFSGATRSKKRQGAGKAVLFSLLMLYVLGCFGFMMYGIFSQLAAPFAAAGLSWLYFSMYGLMSLTLMVIGSVFTAKAQLYEAKDNDLLLSMPIRPGAILASRMLTLGVVNFVCGLIVSVPAAIAWAARSGQVTTGAQWLNYCLISLFIILLSLSLACLLALLMSLFTSRLRSKAAVDTIVSLVFLLAYFWFCFRMNSMIASLAASGSYLAGKLGGVAPLYWMGLAIAEGNIGCLAATLAICIVPFAAIYAVLAATFLHTATAKRGAAKIKYVQREQKVSSPFSALYRRELARFTSSSGYLINAGLGAIFMVVGAVVLLVKGQALFGSFSQLPGLAKLLTPVLILGVCAISGMTTISAPSVSIEGKNLWIAQSLPVPAAEILKAKLTLHISILLPAMLCDVAALLIVLRPSGAMLALALVLPPVFVFFTGVLGLTANLRHPNFDWVTETQCVKNSMAVMIALFGSWGALIPPFVLLFAVSELPPWAVLTVFTAAIAAADVLLYRWIATKGARRFSEMK